MKPVKAMTIRLSAEQAEHLETIASVADVTVSEVVRIAIAEHIEACRQDEAFRDSLRQRLLRAQRLLGDPPAGGETQG